MSDPPDRRECLRSQEMPFKACYCHPNRPAIRDCSKCGRPICSECSKRSDDAYYCESCLEAVNLEILRRKTKKEEAIASTEEAIPIPPAPEPRLPVGDVTVFENGKVEIHFEKEKASSTHTPMEEQSLKEPLAMETRKVSQQEEEELTYSTLKEADELEKAIQRAKKREIKRKVHPSSEATAKAVRLKRPSVKRPVPPKTQEKASEEEEAKITEEAKATSRKPIPSFEILKPLKNNQVFSASLYGLAAGLASYAFWLLFPLFLKRWTEASALTAGIIIPWACLYGSTARIRAGRRVWVEKPSPVKLAIVSLIIMACLCFTAEYLSFRLIIRGTMYGWSDYAINYFKLIDRIILACGIALSFFVPFVLSAGRSLTRHEKINKKTI